MWHVPDTVVDDTPATSMKDKSVFVTSFTFSEEPVKFEQGGSVDFRLWEWHRGDPDSFWMNEQKQVYQWRLLLHVSIRPLLFPTQGRKRLFSHTVHKLNKRKMTFKVSKQLLSLMVVYVQRDVVRLFPACELESDVHVQRKSPERCYGE